MIVRFRLLDERAKLPAKQHKDDSGYDIYALQGGVVKAKSFLKVHTGFSIELPYKWEALVRSRSGLAFNKNVIVINSPGTVDESYRYISPSVPQEVCVGLYNLSDEDFEFEAGARVAQMVFQEVLQDPIFIVIGENGERQGGFGSTGV